MQRPASVTVFGILNLLVFTLGLFGVLMSIPILELREGVDPGNAAYVPLLEHPTYLAFMKVSLGAGLLMSSLLLASGIGLLTMKPWGRMPGIVYSVYALAMGAVGLVLNFVIYLPALTKQTQTMSEPMRTAMTAGAIGGVVGGAVVGIGYPAALLWFLTRPHVAKLFRRGDPADEPPDLARPAA